MQEKAGISPLAEAKGVSENIFSRGGSGGGTSRSSGADDCDAKVTTTRPLDDAMLEAKRAGW